MDEILFSLKKDSFQEEGLEVNIVDMKTDIEEENQESYIKEDFNKGNINQALKINEDEDKISSKSETTEVLQEEKSVSSSCRPSQSKKKDSKGGSFHCNVPLCDKSYMYERDLVTHVKFVHNRVGFLCTICHHLSRNKIDLQTHIDGVHGTPKYLCNICGAKFSQKAGLRTHTQAVHEKIKYDCNECRHVSTTLSSLGWHMKQKHVNIQYSCENCAFKSKTTYALKRHQDGHCNEGIKYPCDQCDYKTTRKGDLFRHKKSIHKLLNPSANKEV